VIRSRRAFLKFLAGSPLFAGLPAFRLQALTDYVISNPAEAIVTEIGQTSIVKVS